MLPHAESLSLKRWRGNEIGVLPPTAEGVGGVHVEGVGGPWLVACVTAGVEEPGSYDMGKNNSGTLLKWTRAE
jgi:hypothetical protein